MDVDLSTSLENFSSLVECVHNGTSPVAIASRLRRGARVVGRSRLRELTSRSLSIFLNTLFWNFKIRDPQCGCKVFARDFLDKALPLTRSTGWFLDTELLLLARGSDLVVSEIPVRWVDDRDSRVRVMSTIFEMLRGMLGMKLRGWRHRLSGEGSRAKWSLVLLASSMMRGFRSGIRAFLQQVTALPQFLSCLLRRSLKKIGLRLLRLANKLFSTLADFIPIDPKFRISNARLISVGALQVLSPKVPEFVSSHLPAFGVGVERSTRLVLSKLNEDALYGLAAIASGEIIDPLPEDVQDKAYELINRLVEALEGKLLELGNTGWSLDLFVNQEIGKILQDPWNSIPVLQEPGVPETIALIMQARAEVEARKVLEAIGLTDAQSRLFLELNRSLALSKFDVNGDGRISWEDLWTAIYSNRTLDEGSTPSTSLKFLRLVGSSVALSPVLNTLVDYRALSWNSSQANGTFQTSFSSNFTKRLEEELHHTVMAADKLFINAVNNVEASLGRSMRSVYYTTDGKPIAVERDLAKPVFETLFRSIQHVRGAWRSLLDNIGYPK
ncbi:hypothetical protein GUITHDRAFT_103074 [Guillardia theta CCMP2712]|uniref:EF-hand domain-containing protein n=1 Tax=Guillardia theta (strain CCMP2712) TaxID=905079 RepID=L1JS66_GUITC|nr:hypothetical protein GUITHDRAFT_103074 [Guillardia theta CCMP2712]EKX51154.1 hypothetical protein GUITHDRAFT_103074 [Guillardia theta CCMP2712]|eukprot:XP_005838134.1 hypothetical protein GUITHDRAFT_103074 [Guillardia theta CCMP2712]